MDICKTRKIASALQTFEDVERIEKAKGRDRKSKWKDVLRESHSLYETARGVALPIWLGPEGNSMEIRLH